MTGLLARIKEQPREVLDSIAKSMNVRASEPAMQAISARYMAQIILPKGARVLEVGCGNGASTKLIMQHVDPAQLVGIDPSPVFVEMAGATFAGEPRVSFGIGDAAVTGQNELPTRPERFHNSHRRAVRGRSAAGGRRGGAA